MSVFDKVAVEKVVRRVPPRTKSGWPASHTFDLHLSPRPQPQHSRTRSTDMGESRTELLAWLNDLLQVNYTKIEQCGSGGAYCQIMDSIYGAQPPTRYLSRRAAR